MSCRAYFGIARRSSNHGSCDVHSTIAYVNNACIKLLVAIDYQRFNGSVVKPTYVNKTNELTDVTCRTRDVLTCSTLDEKRAPSARANYA